MRSFAKKLACVVAAVAMIVTTFPAAKAEAAEKFELNLTNATLYVDKGADYNVQMFDFNFKTAPADYLTAYDFAWATDNAAVATVEKGGKTYAVGVGTAKISCAVTEKATKEVTVYSANVTVKRNAAKVVITNAAEFDGRVFKAGETIDLNRKMIDAAGNETAKRGSFVTDYTKWVCDPEGAATINQATGEFTFTEKATGDVLIYCYTYQSDKHTEAVAISDPIMVSVNPVNEVSIKQNTPLKFTINFTTPVKTLTDKELEFFRLYTTATTKFEYPIVTKKITVADDGLSAAVELFAALADGAEYIVRMAGFEDVNWKASVGAPVKMTLFTNTQNENEPTVVANVATTIGYHLYDANGVDVTIGNEAILFNVETYSNDGSYYVAGNQIWFAKSNQFCNVIAEYQSGKYENGVSVGNVKAEQQFFSVDKPPITFGGIVDATINGWGDKKSLEAPIGETPKLEIKVKVSDQKDPVTVTYNNYPITNVGIISFTTLSNLKEDKAILNTGDMSVILLNQGVATIVVNLATPNANGGYNDPVPIGSVLITVKAGRALTSVTPDKSFVTVGSVDGFDIETIKLAIKDQYGADFPAAIDSIEGINDLAKSVIGGVSGVGSQTITFDGSVLAAAIKAPANAIQLTYKVKVGSKEFNVNVLVKNELSNPQADYINIEASTNNVDMARTAASKDAKSVKFVAYQMSNGIKKGILPITAATAPATVADDGKYFFKVFKNEEDITAKVAAISGGAQINFSSLTAITDGAVTGSAVKYDFGAGSYSFRLLKGVTVNGNAIFVQQNQSLCAATCNTGSFTLASRLSDKVASADDAAIRACFSVKNVKGDETTAPFSVNVEKATLDAGSPQIYVKSITFYESVGAGEYAPYTVNVNMSLIKAY